LVERTVFSPSAAQGSLRQGVRLNDLYELGPLIAHGGMGEVYRGFNVVTNDPVAIKMILPELSSNPEAFAMFKREASTLHNLQHEAIVRYFVFSVDPDLQRAYLAMEFVDGPSLSKSVSNRPMTVEEVGILQRRLAGALHAAHQAGIIHRDISSENIILQNGDPRHAKIIDFGIARSLRATDGTIIGESFAGKYNYASPEQLGLAGGVVAARSDIYSLGLVLAEALRGRPLDMSGSQAETIEKRRRVPDLSDIPSSIRPLIAQMLQPLPADRPESMAAVAAWLPAGSQGRQAANDRGRRTSTLGRAAAAVAALIVIGSIGATVYVFRDAIPSLQLASPPAKTPSAAQLSPPDSGAAALPKLPPLPADRPALAPEPGTSESQLGSTSATPPPAAHPPTADELVDALNKARARRQQSADLTSARPPAEAPSNSPSKPSPVNPATPTQPAATSSSANGLHSAEAAANPPASTPHALSADDMAEALAREKARNKPAAVVATRPPVEAAPSAPSEQNPVKPATAPPTLASNPAEPKSGEAPKPVASATHPLTADDIVAALARERARAKAPVTVPKPPASEAAPANQSAQSNSSYPSSVEQTASRLGNSKPQDQPPVVTAKPSTAEASASETQPAVNVPEAQKNDAVTSKPHAEPQSTTAPNPPPLRPPVEAPAPRPAKPTAGEGPAEIAAPDILVHPEPRKNESSTTAPPPAPPIGDRPGLPEKPPETIAASPKTEVAALDQRPAAPEARDNDTAAPTPEAPSSAHAPPPLPPPGDALAPPAPLAAPAPDEQAEKPKAEIMAAKPPAAEASPPEDRPTALVPEPPKNDAAAPGPAPHAAQSLVMIGGAVVGEDYAADLPPFSDAGDVKSLRLRVEPEPPAGLAFVDLGSGFARLAGTPKEAGAYSFDIIASDAGAASARLTVKIAIAPAAAPVSIDPAKLAAVEPVDKAAEFLRTFDGGPCFVARSTGANGPIPIILGVGADKQIFQRFYEAFNRTVGVEPSLTVRLIASSQCPAIGLIGAGAPGEVNAPRIELSNFEVGRNRPLAGLVSNLLGRSLALLLIGSDGQVHRIETQPRANGASAAFSVPISATGADAAVTQVVIAIVSPKPLPALVGFKAGAATDILPRVESDLAAARGALQAEFFRFVN
jgi:serine/threonine protein kinase